MSGAPVTDVRAQGYEIPCEQHESDGTMEWDSVTVVVAEVDAEASLFDGVLAPRDGALHPDAGRPGRGIELKRADAERFSL